eukprot:2038841-Rhodomonas_salina.4
MSVPDIAYWRRSSIPPSPLAQHSALSPLSPGPTTISYLSTAPYASSVPRHTLAQYRTIR